MPDPKKVKAMFTSVAPSYNFMNTAMTLGLDGLQRHRLARMVADTAGGELVDIACGSGVLSFAIAEEFEKQKKSCHIMASDFCEELLAIARRELAKKNYKLAKIEFKNADALALPLGNTSANVVTIGFGIRNFESREKAYAEILRVLKPGGELFILETSQPTGIRRWFYNHVWTPMIPAFARLVNSDPMAYEYLVRSYNAFPDAKTLAAEMEAGGFKEVRFRRLLGGALAIHRGRKAT